MGASWGNSLLLIVGCCRGAQLLHVFFSLFMDRLESHVDETCATWDPRARQSIMLAGVVLPLLLFADDVVLASRNPKVT